MRTNERHWRRRLDAAEAKTGAVAEKLAAARRRVGDAEKHATGADDRLRAAEDRAAAAEERSAASEARREADDDAAATRMKDLETEAGELRDALAALETQHQAHRDAAWSNAKDFGYAYRRLVAAVRGVRPGALGHARTRAPERADAAADLTEAASLVTEAAFTRLIVGGAGLDDAVAAFVRANRREAEVHRARALSHALLRHESTAAAGSLGVALIAADRDLPEFTWRRLAAVPRATWRRLAAVQFFRAGFVVDQEAAVREAEALIEDSPADVAPSAWLVLVRLALGAGRDELAVALMSTCERLAAADPDGWQEEAAELAWIRPWIRRITEPAVPSVGSEAPASEAPVSDVPVSTVSFGVIDYKTPDRRRASSDLGDYVQTIAALGHLVRHTDVAFTGADGLGAAVSALQSRVRQVDARPGGGEVRLVPVNRDASGRDPIPPDTWMLAFGWYAHAIGDVRHDFPFHPNLRPIYVSFHVNRRRMLTPEAIEHLRAHAPVGCRDWTTVDLLRSVGVPAFFSGCITTTLGTLFPERPDLRGEPDERLVAYVDVDPPEDAADVPVIRQENEDVRQRDLVANLDAAADLLDSYQRDHSKIVTGRLHSYLPGRALGVPVDFTPNNRADVRFNGLLDLDDGEFAAMGDGIGDLLAPVIDAILAGEGTDTVRAVWEKACAPFMAIADERAAGLPPVRPTTLDVAGTCEAIRAARVHVARRIDAGSGPEVNVALAMDANLRHQTRVVVEALATTTSRPLHVHLLTRDHGLDDHRLMAELFPRLSFTWWPFDGVEYGEIASMLTHITVSTMDRLLLPELLPDLDRIVYHDIDALPVADIAELHDWDLGGAPLAARDAETGLVRSGFVNAYSPARRLGDRPADAHDLIQRIHARHAYDFVGFNAGILVLDLARLRRDGFTAEALAWAERYGMNDQQILNCFVGPDRAALPAAWNAWPIQEIVTDPKIIHWLGGHKPWLEGYVLFREQWQATDDRVRRRIEALRPG